MLNGKRVKYGPAQDQPVPVEFKEYIKFNPDTDEEVAVQFHHERNERNYFFDPELLHLLSEELNADGTFFIAKKQTESQMYMVGRQLFNDDFLRTHCQPLVCVFEGHKKRNLLKHVGRYCLFLQPIHKFNTGANCPAHGQ